MRDLLDRTGYDVRVTATEQLPRSGPPIAQAQQVTATVAALPEVRAALAVRFVDAQIDRSGGGTALPVSLQGISGKVHCRGWSPAAPTWHAATRSSPIRPSPTRSASTSARSSRCARRAEWGWRAMPPLRLRLVGIAEFPFELTSENSVGTTLDTVSTACGSSDDDADLILVTSHRRPGRDGGSHYRGTAGPERRHQRRRCSAASSRPASPTSGRSPPC